MTSDLLTRIREVDPAAAAKDGDYEERDREIFALATASMDRPRAARRRATWVVAVLAGIACLGLIVASRPGHDFDAAAQTYRALTRHSGVYHFISTSRFARPRVRVDVGMKPPFALPYFYEPEQAPSRGGYQYEEDWVTLDGTRIKWVKFKTRGGVPIGPRAAASFTQPRGRSQAPTDPASSFRRAYRQGTVRSRGPVRYQRRPAWRFAATTRNRSEEWVVDRKTWLPLRYRYRQGRVAESRTTLDVRFLKFEVLPVTAKTKQLFALTPEERRVAVH